MLMKCKLVHTLPSVDRLPLCFGCYLLGIHFILFGLVWVWFWSMQFLYQIHASETKIILEEGQYPLSMAKHLRTKRASSIFSCEIG
ncbi:hypothetical protein L6452_22823 [Arctium lappa]|uniref:Uncharacterized protein n=1 Tax=Arctium lappa TaxID=4217 RepID=A0ACB9B0Y6_ARCLA|nr:hypothetical protein L6452_22823 [Arctium lappa]